MSTTSDTVRVNRSTLERLKEYAAMGKKMLHAETIEERDAARRSLKANVKEDAVILAKGTPMEIEATQSRSGIRIAGVAALIQFLTTMETVKNIELAQKHWWLVPAAVAALGWYLKSKGYKDGPTLLAIGAAMFVQAYRDQEAVKKNPPQAQPQAQPQTQGFTDTGAPFAAAAPIAGQSVWLQTPWGGWTRVALPGPAYTFAASAPPALGQPSNTNTAGPTQEEYEAAQRLAAAAFAA